MSSSDPQYQRDDSPYSSPQTESKPTPPVRGEQEGDATGGLIPYKNGPALLAYYCGLFSLLPCIGILLSIPALVLGIWGLRNRARNPAVKGSVHAWIGIVMGGLMTLIWGAMIVLMIIGAVNEM